MKCQLKHSTFLTTAVERALTVAERLDIRLIRIFSFYVRPENLDEVRNEVIERLGLLVERAAQAGVTLLHENERDIYGESATGRHDLLATIKLADAAHGL